MRADRQRERERESRKSERERGRRRQREKERRYINTVYRMKTLRAGRGRENENKTEGKKAKGSQAKQEIIQLHH